MPVLNEREFIADVSRFASKLVPEQAALFHRRITLDALARVVLKTPVDTGRARGNWQVSIGAPASGTVDAKDPGGGSTIARGSSAVATLPTYGVTHLTNNLPYIEVLEYGLYPNPPKGGTGKTVGGFSRQAPQGMVGVTLEELRAGLAGGGAP